MEWKSARTEKPALNSICVTVDVKGVFSLRRYQKAYVFERNYKKYHWQLEPVHGGEERELFTPIANSHGPVPTKDLIMYFCEVPVVPNGFQEANEIREQIKQLEKRLEALGGTA